MSITPSEIFKNSATGSEFRTRIIALEGEFPFESDDMIELGKEYFSRYPDSFSDRKMNEVHEGYAIARICILEKMLYGIEQAHKPYIREIFENISRIEESMQSLKKIISSEKLAQYHGIMDENLSTIMAEIENIPRGMIKERFIGGITKFFNVMYLIKSKICA